ncbi:CumB Cytosine/adenosine deaminases [Candidatus Nanopelagicaceae bacterium]
MRSAIAVAKSALKTADVPVGALIVDGENNIIATGYNEREAHQDPTAHAEIVAIRRAAQKLGTWRLTECKLVVTLEPCAMCAGAIAQSRIGILVFGAWDEKAGAVGSVWDVLRDPRAIHKMEVIGGVLEAECAELLTSFFREQ